MANIAKTKKTDVAQVNPPDLVQMTILMDRSGSMSGVWDSAVQALIKLRKDLQLSLLSVQTFNHGWTIVKDFDNPDEQTDSLYPEGDTNLYGAILNAVEHSREIAGLTPEFKAHHVFVVVTDGESNSHTKEEYERCKAECRKMDVDATFLMLDSSYDQAAGKGLGWVSTKFDNTPKSIIDAIKKVQKTLEKITDNVDKKLPPASGLLLPPAQ